MNRSVKSLLWTSALLSLSQLATTTATVDAQVTGPRVLGAGQERQPTLQELLTNRLKATTEQQRNYVREIVRLVDTKRLDQRLVLAIERYARRRSSYFPLPFFERALKVESAKRGVAVPMIRDMVATRSPAGARERSRNDSRVF